MMPEEVLALVAEKLEECGVAYMITGSFSSNRLGLPRTTHDADVIIEIDELRIERVSQTLGKDFYFDVDAARDAVRTKFMCSALHYDTGFKIDFIVLKNRSFSRMEFSRRQAVEFLGRQCWFATAEDTILAKLEWSKKGESERQLLDAVDVAKVQAKNLDVDYLRRWAADLQVDELMNYVLQEIEPFR